MITDDFFFLIMMICRPMGCMYHCVFPTETYLEALFAIESYLSSKGGNWYSRLRLLGVAVRVFLEVGKSPHCWWITKGP